MVTASIATLTTNVEGRNRDELLETRSVESQMHFQKATRMTPFRLLFAYEPKHFKVDSLNYALRDKNNVTEDKWVTDDRRQNCLL